MISLKIFFCDFIHILEFHVSENSLCQADETLMVLNANGATSLRKIHSSLRKAGESKLLKLGCVGSITPFGLANGELLMKLIVMKAPENKEVKLSVPIKTKEVPLISCHVPSD
jgi:hypothetical protein